MLETIGVNLLVALATSKPVILALLYAFAFTLVFWLLWVNLNVLHNRMEKRRGWRKALVAVFFWPLLPFGALVDIVYNKTVGTILFWEWGCETTLSMRMTRYISGRTCDKLGRVNYGYRVAVAAWISTRLVEPWAPGHIGIEKYGLPPAKNLIDGFMNRYKKLFP